MDCDYSSAKETLRFLYQQDLNRPVPTGKWAQYGDYKRINVGKRHSSILDTAGIYIPNQCKDGKKLCKLHVFLHGCTLSYKQIGDRFNQNTGLLEVAATNDVVVFFPSVNSDDPLTKIPMYNFKGCWDLGYSP